MRALARSTSSPTWQQATSKLSITVETSLCESIFCSEPRQCHLRKSLKINSLAAAANATNAMSGLKSLFRNILPVNSFVVRICRDPFWLEEVKRLRMNNLHTRREKMWGDRGLDEWAVTRSAFRAAQCRYCRGSNFSPYTSSRGWPTLSGLCKGIPKSEHHEMLTSVFLTADTVQRGLVLEPEQWAWSSSRSYAYQEDGRVKINQWPKAVMKVRSVA